MNFYCGFCGEYGTFKTCPWCERPCKDILGMEAGSGQGDMDLGEELDINGLHLVDDDGLDFDD